VQGRITSVKNKLRRILSHYNADVKNLFTHGGRKHLESLRLSDADRFAADMLWEELNEHSDRLKRVDKQLQVFAQQATVAEKEAREILDSMPCVGPVTIDVVLAEAGDIRRFGSQRKAAAYAGLAPGIRESAGKAKQLGITKEGSRLLRTILVETAWRLVIKTRRWGSLYEKLKSRCGAKKAIVAVARRVWCVMVSILRSGQKYQCT
jgi:transposase